MTRKEEFLKDYEERDNSCNSINLILNLMDSTESITNDNIDSKVEYVKDAYDDDLRLKSNNKISIVDWVFFTEEKGNISMEKAGYKVLSIDKFNEEKPTAIYGEDNYDIVPNIFIVKDRKNDSGNFDLCEELTRVQFQEGEIDKEYGSNGITDLDLVYILRERAVAANAKNPIYSGLLFNIGKLMISYLNLAVLKHEVGRDLSKIFKKESLNADYNNLDDKKTIALTVEILSNNGIEASLHSENGEALMNYINENYDNDLKGEHGEITEWYFMDNYVNDAIEGDNTTFIDYTSERSTTDYTKIKHEKDFKYNAPHTFVVESSKDPSMDVGYVHFQEGPIKESGVNGVANEDVLNMVCCRLEHFQDSKYKCKENEEALKYLYSALDVLKERTNKRIKRNVEGTMNV